MNHNQSFTSMLERIKLKHKIMLESNNYINVIEQIRYDKMRFEQELAEGVNVNEEFLAQKTGFTNEEVVGSFLTIYNNKIAKLSTLKLLYSAIFSDNGLDALDWLIIIGFIASGIYIAWFPNQRNKYISQCKSKLKDIEDITTYVSNYKF